MTTQKAAGITCLLLFDVEQSMSTPNVFSQNLIHHVECKYDRNYPYDGCNCPQDDYCRCTILENIRAFTPYTPTFHVARALVRELSAQRGSPLSEIQQYALERFLRIKLGKDGLEFNACGGLYGEEMDSIHIKNNDRIWEEYQPFLNCTDDAELIRMILLLDYGYISESIEGFTRVSLDLADLNSITPGNQEYLHSLNDLRAVETYSKQWFTYWNNTVINTDIPLCVCRKSGNRLVLVDGYHRYATLSTEGSKNMVFFVIVLE